MKLLATVSVLMALTTQVSANPSGNQFATAKELGLMEGFPVPEEKAVTKENTLVTAPYNRYSYLHMRNFYPTAIVQNAEVASELNKNIDDSIGTLMIPIPGSDKTVSMDTYLERTFTDSFVVIKGDTVVYEKYLNGMTENQPHQMMSVTKSFAGLLGLMAVEDGLLSEDDKISKHVPELKNATAFGDATFRQLLNMTNSMKFSEVESDPDSDYFVWAAVLGLSDKQKGKEYADNMYDYLMGVSKTAGLEHGSEFHYQTPKADVVNWVVNKVTHESFQDYLHDKIWSKI